MSEEKPKKRVWGRWAVLALVLLSAFLFSGIFGIGLEIEPIMPHVYLPGEKLSHDPLFGIPGLYMTNTFVGLIIADILVILLAIAIFRGVKSGKMVLTGLGGFFEAMLEMLYNITESTAGKWAKQLFPWFATITLLVLAANWSGLVPGKETIGLYEEYYAEKGHPIVPLTADGSIVTVWQGGAGIPTFDREANTDKVYSIVPFFRPVSTDLNFTLALALVAVTMIQYYGLKSQGLSYLTKFFNVKNIFKKPIFGTLDFVVGLLELVSEFSKILSFTFRLFGTMFAGAVLLFVIGLIAPIFGQSLIYLLEFFVGLIQALVFGMLTMVFMAQATQGHGEHHDEEHA